MSVLRHPRAAALLACGAVSALTLACAARHHEIRTATGEPGYRITCQRDSKYCYERATELCPQGYRTLEDDEQLTGVAIQRDMKGNLQGVNAHTQTELTVVCGTQPVAESPAPAMVPASAVSVPSAPAAPAPTGAAGYAFGATPSEAQAACEGAGHKWQPHPTSPTCSGIPGNTGYRGTSRVGICHTGRLCWVSLQVADASATSRDELAQTLARKYPIAQRTDAQGTTFWQWPDTRYVALEALREDRAEVTLWYADQDGARLLSAQGL